MAAPTRILSLSLGNQTLALAEFKTGQNGGLVLSSHQTRELLADPAADATRLAQAKLVLDEMVQGAGLKNAKINYAVSALRSVGANTMGDGVLSYLEAMGQLPFKWTTPDGYPDRAASWAPGLLARWNFAADLVQNKIPGTAAPVDRLAAAIGGEGPIDTVRGLSRLTLGKMLPEPHIIALSKLGGDGWDRDRAGLVRQWSALMLSSPQFQWC